MTSREPDSSLSPRPSFNEHLSFPVHEPSPPLDASPSSQPRQLLKDRLYIGNIHPSVDEYSLLQIFSKFGKVTHLDFLFHRAGALKGKPRGYAFIEYGSSDEALKALTMAHEKHLRGRKLVVTYAHQAPIDATGSSTLKRKSMMETGRPTALSIIKTGMGMRNDGTKDKIAMMEAKLRQMEAMKPKPADAEFEPVPFASTSRSSHPSLPAKPPPQLPACLLTLHQSSQPSHSKPKPSVPMPSLPIVPPAQTLSQTLLRPSKTLPARTSKPTKLVGVKIGKPKEKITTPPKSQ